MENFWDFIQHFSRSEIACKCNCGTENVAFEIMWLADRLHDLYEDMLKKVGEEIDPRLTINSGCRCPTRNIAEKGSENSYHIAIPGERECRALDLSPTVLSARKLLILASAASKLNPPGMKVYHSFVHIDFRRGKWRQQ